MVDPKRRSALVERVHRYLEAAGRPRLVMVLVLGVAFAAGFLASMGMVRMGVDRMSVRYPLAVGVGYATFLGTLWVWLRQQAGSPMAWEDPEGLLVPGAAAFGAAGLVDKPAKEEEREPEDARNNGWFGWGGGRSGGDLGDVGVLVLLAILAGLCTLIVSLYLVATSPLLLAELFVDGVLLGAMSRAIGPEPAPHWSRAVVRRTWLAALFTATVFGLVGYGIERTVPGARTFGEAWAIDHGRR